MSKNNNIDFLYKEANKYKLLTLAEEQTLFSRFKSGDMGARDLIINSNLRLVINEATKKKGENIAVEDAVMEGIFGLERAVNKFDHTRGCKFSTYATYWIDQYISTASAQSKGIMHIPTNILNDRREITKYRAQFLNTYGVLPSMDEIAIALNFTKKRIDATNCFPVDVISIDEPTGRSDDTTKVEFIKDEIELTPEEVADEKLIKKTVNEILDRLPKEQREVIKLRYGIGCECQHSIPSVAKHLNISVQKATELQAKAYKSLRMPSNARVLRELMR